MTPHHEAYVLRENTGTSGLVTTALAAVSALCDHDIPHLVVGGLAVQEHGYPRVTLDVDLVVPDVLEAVEFITADVAGPFVRLAGCEDSINHKITGVKVDFLPAGKVLKPGCKVPFPTPTSVSEALEFTSLESLISLKLDASQRTPLHRLKDKTDAVELIVRRRLPRDLAVADAVKSIYVQLWDGLKAEQ